jgi:putative peptidoglycan lipid II flippase
MKISIACLVLNLGIALVLVVPYHQAGLGVANTASSAANVGLLLYALRRKLGRLDFQPLQPTLWPLLAAAAAAAAMSWWGWKWWELRIGHASLALKIGAVFVPGIAASLAYAAVALAGRVPAARELAGLVFRRLRH